MRIGSSTYLMGKGRCREATEAISQTRECLVSHQRNLCVLAGRRISPVPSGQFRFCHLYPARCAGLISSVASRPPNGAMKVLSTINSRNLYAGVLYFDVVNDSETISASQFLNPILRRELGRVGLLRGEAGWIGVDDL